MSEERNIQNEGTHENHENGEQFVHENTHNLNPSAPPSDDNGFFVVQPPASEQPQQNASETILDTFKSVKDQQNEISKLLDEIGQNAEQTLDKVIAEADSTFIGKPKVSEPEPAKPASKPESKPVSQPSKPTSNSSSSGCSLCPYYALGIEYMSKVQLPPKARDLLLWKNPKYTGAVFGTSLVLLISLASFSLLTVIGTLMLLALSVVGAYRFYLAVIFRIKGTHDGIFDKLSSYDLSLPKEKVQDLARLLETDINLVLNKIKSIILWDNVATSSFAFIGFYFLYCVGSVFNTLTLLILGLVSLFTLPKVYQVYKKPIDDVIEKSTSCIHNVVKQAMKKLPFLNKKKVQ